MVSGTGRLGGSRLAGLGGGGGSNGRAGGREVCVMEESLGDGGEGVQVVGRCGWCVQVRGIIPQILDGHVGRVGWGNSDQIVRWGRSGWWQVERS